MNTPHVHIITQEDTVIVRGTFPEITLKDVTVTQDSVILVGEHFGHQFVQELPLETNVNDEDAVVVFDNGDLTIIIPRGDEL